MNPKFLTDTLVALLVISYVIYLQRSIQAGKPALAKYPKGSQAYSLYKKVYSLQFLKVVIAFAISCVLSLVVDTVILLASNDSVTFAAQITFFAINLPLSIYIIVWLYRLFVKKEA